MWSWFEFRVVIFHLVLLQKLGSFKLEDERPFTRKIYVKSSKIVSEHFFEKCTCALSVGQ